MMKDAEPGKIEDTVRKLASRDEFFSHGSVIDHTEAKKLGLTVNFLPHESELWQRFWLLYTMYAHDIQQSGAVKMFEGNSRSLAVLPS
jgi:hypothetical protein